MRPSLRVLAPLRHRDFRLLVGGTLVSLLGDGFFRVAIGIQVLLVSNDAGALAAVAVVWALGQVVALPAGGWASDRFERRRVMVAADLWRGTMIGTLGVLSLIGSLELWHLLVLGASFGIGNGFFNPAATALVPDLLDDDELAQANAFLGVARPTMLWIVGPLIGGLLVDAAGAGAAFVVDAGTFALSACFIGLVASRPVGEPSGEGLRETVAQIREGLGWVRHNTWAWAWLTAGAVSTLMWHGPFDVLVPYLLRNELAMSAGEVARTMAAIFTAGGAGSVTASLALGQWDLPRRFMTALYVCEAAAVSSLVGFGLMRTGWHGVVAGFALFTLFAVSEVIWTTTMQRLVPREMLGRVASVDWFTSVSLAPFSFLMAWWLQAVLDVRIALVTAGLLGPGLLLLLMAVPGARQPERRRSGGRQRELTAVPAGEVVTGQPASEVVTGQPAGEAVTGQPPRSAP